MRTQLLYSQMVDVQATVFQGLSNLKKKNLTLGELLDQAASVLNNGWFSTGNINVKVRFGAHESSSGSDTSVYATFHSESVVENKGRVYCTIQYADRDSYEQIVILEKECQRLLDLFTSELASTVHNSFLKQKISEKQRLVDKAYKLARIGTWEFNMKTEELYWSPITKEIHGFGEDHVPDVEHTTSLFKEGFDREKYKKAVNEAIEQKTPFDIELKIISGEGDERWIRATGEPEYIGGECVRFYGISQNVTNRKQAQEHIQLSEERFKALVQDGSDLIVILDDDANYRYVSPTVKSVLGYGPDELLNRSAFDFVHPDDHERLNNVLSTITSNTKRLEVEPFRSKNSDGHWRWIETTITDLRQDPAVGGIVANSRDITSRILQEKKLLDSLMEKELLLSEIHHRVKNNLSIVMSLLDLHDNNEKHDSLFKELISRIHTMSQIHEQLYKSENFARLNFAENIKQLSEHITEAFKSNTDITISHKLDQVELNINQAIPCSLIINEAITNCMKHAFAGKESGKIELEIFEEDNKTVRIEIIDNGVGLPQKYETSVNGSLGLSLIRGLSNELRADYSFESTKKGTRFSLRFKKETPESMPAETEAYNI